MSDVTQILQAFDNGDAQAANELLPLVYQELRRLAAHKMANEAPGHTLQPTAMVHGGADLGFCPVMAFARGPKGNDRNVSAERQRILRDFAPGFRMNRLKDTTPSPIDCGKRRSHY